MTRYFTKLSPNRKFLGSDGQYFAFEIHGTGKEAIGLLALDSDIVEHQKKIADIDKAINEQSHRGGVDEVDEQEFKELKKKHASPSPVKAAPQLFGPNAPARVFRPTNPFANARAAATAPTAEPAPAPAGPPPTKKVSPRRKRAPVDQSLPPTA